MEQVWKNLKACFRGLRRFCSTCLESRRSNQSLKIGQVDRPLFVALLSGPGVLLPCGPFAVRVTCGFPELARNLQRMYADFDVLPDEIFNDFSVRVESPSLIRRYVRKQATFECEGRTPFKPVPRSQAYPSLEWGLNWVISTHAHDHLILHAAVLERGGRALLLAAAPGSGKSTLCAALMYAGWRLLSDELALIELSTGLVRPVARPISLKNESIDVVRGLGPDVEISDICHGTTKGSVALMRPSPSCVERREERARPSWLVFPKFNRDRRRSFEPVGKAVGFCEMVEHAFNFGLLSSDAFDCLAKLIDECEIFRAEYGSFDEIVPLLEQYCGRADDALVCQEGLDV